MIYIKMLGEDYEQDIRPLVKAFYPEEELNIVHEDIPFAESYGMSSDSFMGRLMLRLEPNRFFLFFEDGKTELSAEENFEQHIEGVYQNEGTPDRRMYRNYLHRKLYQMLSEATGKELPWGTLTGVRPTKLALERRMRGELPETIANYFKTEYLCSEGKVALCLKVVENESRLLTGITKRDSYSLYIGIPFCPSICLYCSFSSYPVKQYEAYVEPYLEALFREIDFAAGCFPDKKLTSIYIGGGTPTTLSAEQLRRLVYKIKQSFDFTYLREWTVEAGRPDSITREKLMVLKEEGITRISINPQTMQQRTLDLIGRRHTAEQIKEAFHLARECGHDNINMDLIVGLTGEGRKDMEATLSEIEALEPDSITVHTLAIKRAARLNAEKERYQSLKSHEASAMLAACEAYMAGHSYEPYYLYRQKNMSDNLENVGYAREGKEGLYNVLIMEERHTILALGAGGSTKFMFADEDRLERVENVKNVKEYIARIDEMIARKQNFLSQYREFL